MPHCDRIIRSLEDHSSRLHKEAIIEAEAKDGNDELFAGFRLAFDQLKTFGVKKVPTHGGPDGQGLPWVAFVQLAEALYKRELTGHDARDAIELALSVSKKDEWNDWYRRILIKDMRAGFSEGTVNRVCDKAYPQYAIPLFECQLAHDGAKHEKKVRGKKILDRKLDGVRCLTVINMESHTVQQFTRNGQPLDNFGHITAGLQANIELFDRSWVFDGEMTGKSFQKLMTQVKRKSDVQATDSVLNLFDMIPLSEFQVGKSVMGQKRRSALLKSMKPIFDKAGSIEVVDQVEVDLDTEAGQATFKQYNKEALAAGLEGIMIKDPDAPYECKRSVAWLKQKPFIEVSLEIIGVEEGTGKNVGRLGAFVCSGTDDGVFITVNVGSGFTDEQRIEFWNSRDALLGQIVEVRADAITQNQDGSYSLRFPRFLRFRGFVAGQKI
jgi:DNA ligase-1